MRGFADVLPLRFASSVLTAIASKAIGGTPSWRDAVARSARPRTAGGIGAASTLTGIHCGRASGASLTPGTHAPAHGPPGAPAQPAGGQGARRRVARPPPAARPERTLPPFP